MSQYHCRKRGDRRKNTASPFNVYSLMGRRKDVRRSQDGRKTYGEDAYHPVFLVVSIGILLLCFADAFNTMQLLHLGGREVNPMMGVLIEKDISLFVVGKFALTGLGLLVLVAYHHRSLFGLFRVRHVLYFMLFSYMGLIYYQSMLMPPEVLALVLPV